jgi:hypothetical protein
MKKLTVILAAFLLLTQTPAFTQTYDTTEYYGKLNYTFHHVNKSIIGTGILKDYGIEFLELDNYGGTVLHDSNYVGIKEWRLLYGSLFSCQINTNASMLGLDSVNRLLSSYSDGSTPVTFAGLYYHYDRLKDNAISSNLMSVSNDQLYDVPGRPESPYQVEELFTLAPLRQAVKTGANQFIFRPELFWTNTGKTISSIAYDPAGGNNYITASFNTPFNVTYSNKGFYDFSIRITYTDNSVRYAHTKVVAYGEPSNARYGFGEATPPVSEVITATTSYLGEFATGDLIIDLAANNQTGQIRKPLIVVEGFDPTGTFNYDEEDPRLWEADDYVRRMTRDLNSGSFITLNDQLDDVEEYDIIFLNWRNGTDYIQRNALLLQRAIEIVNARKINYNGVRQQNVITGLSMGGLVVRYALRNMELNSIAHETRLFISHDVPHWGANIPVSAQAAVQFLSAWHIINISGSLRWVDLFPGTQEALDLLNSPAARQMVIQHYILAGQSLFADNGIHTAFMTELSTLGWPVNCRNVAISNGSCNGSKVFADNSVIFTVDGDKPVNYWNDLWVSALTSIGGALMPTGVFTGWGNPQFNAWAMAWQFPLSLISFGRTKYIVDFKLRAVPALGTQELFRADIYSRRKILGFININSYFMKCHVNSLSGMLPLDNAPGSTYNIEEFGMDADDIQEELPDMMDFVTVSLLQPEFSFIPTVSSLDFANPAANLRANLCASIPCNVPGSVADYFVPQQNELHISYTQANANWILQRQNASFSCAKICPGTTTISGPSEICNTPELYSIAPTPPGSVNVNWTSTPQTAVIINPSGTSATLTKNVPNDMVLQASLTNTCSGAPVVIQKNIRVGTPRPVNYSICGNDPNDGCRHGRLLFSIYDNYPTGSTYYWYVNNVLTATTSQPTWIYTPVGGCDQFIELSVQVDGPCGTSPLAGEVVYYACPGGMRMAPNPAINSVTVSLDPDSKNFIKEVRVQDKTGKVRKLIRPSAAGKSVSLDLSDLAPDVYFVRIFDGNKWTVQRIIKR